MRVNEIVVMDARQETQPGRQPGEKEPERTKIPATKGGLVHQHHAEARDQEEGLNGWLGRSAQCGSKTA